MKKIGVILTFVALGTFAFGQEQQPLQLQKVEKKVATEKVEAEPATKPAAVTNVKPIEEKETKKQPKVRKMESSFVVPAEATKEQ